MTEANAYSLTQEGAQKLSTHFRVREFACKDGSDPLFISPQLVQLLEQVRTHFNAPVFVNSGYRTPAYNHSIPHAKSQAVTDTKLEELTREVREHNHFARRIPILEEQMKVANHRIQDLEQQQKERYGYYAGTRSPPPPWPAPPCLPWH